MWIPSELEAAEKNPANAVPFSHKLELMDAATKLLSAEEMVVLVGLDGIQNSSSQQAAIAQQGSTYHHLAKKCA
jgi:hypothetical protein